MPSLVFLRMSVCRIFKLSMKTKQIAYVGLENWFLSLTLSNHMRKSRYEGLFWVRCGPGKFGSSRYLEQDRKELIKSTCEYVSGFGTRMSTRDVLRTLAYLAKFFGPWKLLDTWLSHFPLLPWEPGNSTWYITNANYAAASESTPSNPNLDSNWLHSVLTSSLLRVP